TPTPETPVATPTPTPVAPVVTPTPTTTPPAPTAVVKSLALKGQITKRKSAKVTYTVSMNAAVTVTVTRAGCRGVKSCSAATSRWVESARTFTLGRRVAGRTLSAGRYTLTVAVGDSARSIAFRVR